MLARHPFSGLPSCTQARRSIAQPFRRWWGHRFPCTEPGIGTRPSSSGRSTKTIYFVSFVDLRCGGSHLLLRSCVVLIFNLAVCRHCVFDLRVIQSYFGQAGLAFGTHGCVVLIFTRSRFHANCAPRPVLQMRLVVSFTFFGNGIGRIGW